MSRTPLAVLLLPSQALAMCAGWCVGDTVGCSHWKCVACAACQPRIPPLPPGLPVPPLLPLPPMPPPVPSLPPYRSNPFLTGQGWYVNEERRDAVAYAVHTLGLGAEDSQRLMVAYEQPTAVWIDEIAAIRTARRVLLAASRHSPPMLVTLVVYNLPNRDCGAKSSGGELCCAAMPPGRACEMAWGVDCTHGLMRYAFDFIDPIRALIAEFPAVPVQQSNLEPCDCRM